LIHGASGAVGQAATQLAKRAGMTVAGTAGSAGGCELVREIGADVVFNHNEKRYVEKLAKEAGGGFDLILEMLANVNLDNDLELLAPRGRVVIIGSRGRVEIDPRATMGKETDIRGFSLFSATGDENQQIHAGLREAIEDGALVPKISREMALVEAPGAHDLVMKNGNCGKIVLLP
jgi:NADPH2:quinone reductase